MCFIPLTFIGQTGMYQWATLAIYSISLVVTVVMFKRSINKETNEKISNKADRKELEDSESRMKIYVDNSDKSLLMMIQEIQQANNRDHDAIQRNIDNRLESMDKKLNILIEKSM